MNKNKKLPKSKLNIRVLVACVLLLSIVIVGISIAKNSSKGESSTYRETAVQYGNLTVGVTESGTVDIGTIEQTFDLDMSALTRVTTSNTNSSSSSSGSSFGQDMGGMPSMGVGGSSNNTSAFGQMFSFGESSGTSSSSSDSKLVVESLNVAVGQEISAGDVILTLESEGVEELKTELEENTTKAFADLEALIADQKLSKITADYTLSTSLKYGDYAKTEKDATIASLKQDITDAEEALASAKKSLSTYQEQLTTAKNDYANALVVEENLIFARDHYDKYSETYYYTLAFEEAESAISTRESLESKVEQLESKVEQATTTVERCETNLAKAKRSYDSGVLTAQQNYDIKMLAYNTAEETYDITVSYMEDNLNEQQETYDEAVSKWNEFTSYINGVNILSEYSGVITSISLAVGDGLDTGATVITLYNADDVTMTVTVSEDDMTDIKLGGIANVSLTAYPNEIFEATVTEISDASTDNSGNTTRDVTVTIKGDMSKLYQGMTGEVTFITKQVENIFFVNNRAIIRENGVSYVKVKEDNGNIKKIKVVTGFSDGTNVEIVEGLSEGQTVIIEKGDTK